MSNTLKLIKRVTLQPGEYTIKELVWAADYIVPLNGELAGTVYCVVGSDLTDRMSSERFPITLSFFRTRGWRTGWRWRTKVILTDGEGATTTVEQDEKEIPSLHPKLS